MGEPRPLPDFDPAEVAFNAEAVRSYFFRTGLDVFEQMRTDGITKPEVAVMTGALEFAAQLWMWVAMRSGVTKQKARQTAEKEFRTFLIRHATSKDTPAPEEGKPS